MSLERKTAYERISRFAREEFSRQLLLSIVSPILFILAWEVSSRAGVIDPRFFPTPSSVFALWVEMVSGAEGDLLYHTYVSLSRIVPAFVIGGGFGVLLGLLIGWSETLHIIFDPIVSAAYPIPKVVLLPIIFLIFGLSEISRIIALGLAVFLLVVINTSAGARQVNQEYIEAAKDYGASDYAMLREVILPASIPHIFSGLSLGMGVAFILIVVVEMIAADSGLGFIIWNSWELFTIRRMYVAIVTINIFGIVFTYGIDWIGKYLARWQT